MNLATGSNSPKVLVIDIGGTHVKVLATGHKSARKIPSGPSMTPSQMVEQVKRVIKDWDFDVVSMGFPGPVVHGRPLREPNNLGCGWIGFNFRKAFSVPVKIINDAAMQALGSYTGGRMLFLGLGTGLGSAVVVNGIMEPMELAHLPYKKRKTYEDYVGARGLKRLGKKKWRKQVAEVVRTLKEALEVEYVVLGGGNSRKLKKLPPNTRWGNNRNAFLGGFRLWESRRTRKVSTRVQKESSLLLPASPPAEAAGQRPEEA